MLRNYHYLSSFLTFSRQLVLSEDGLVQFVVDAREGSPGESSPRRLIAPEYVGAQILRTLRDTAESRLGVPITKVVMAVPAEFDEEQRNATRKAAAFAGMYLVLNQQKALRFVANLLYSVHGFCTKCKKVRFIKSLTEKFILTANLSLICIVNLEVYCQ